MNREVLNEWRGVDRYIHVATIDIIKCCILWGKAKEDNVPSWRNSKSKWFFPDINWSIGSKCFIVPLISFFFSFLFSIDCLRIHRSCPLHVYCSSTSPSEFFEFFFLFLCVGVGGYWRLNQGALLQLMYTPRVPPLFFLKVWDWVFLSCYLCPQTYILLFQPCEF